MKILEYKENKSHGSFDFPIEGYYVGNNHPRYIMPLHWHKEHEIIKIIKGTFRYEIGLEKGIAKAGDILYINSGVLHTGTPEECEYCCIVFDIDFLIKGNTASGKILTSLMNGETIILLNLPHDNDLKEIVQKMLDLLFYEVNGNEIKIQGLLLLLLGTIIQNQYYTKTDNKTANKNLVRLKHILSFIEKNYFMPVTLEMLACEAGMSPKYFCRYFKQITHHTPINYLNRFRIEVACYHLMSGSNNITEVGYMCGFNELSYFIRVFKKIAGITPKQYFYKYNPAIAVKTENNNI